VNVENAAKVAVARPARTLMRRHQLERASRHEKRHLGGSTLKLAGYLVLAYLLLKLVPSLKEALSSLEHVRWEWLAGAVALELISEIGFVVSWHAIIDPDDSLERDGRGRRTDERVAWTQLGGGLLVPGGAWGGAGVGAWILHRFGMPTRRIAERQLNLSFLNTAVDGLPLIVFGLALAAGVLPGARNPLLTLLPALVAAAGLAATLAVARHIARNATRRPAKHARIAGAIVALAQAVEDTGRLLWDRKNYRAVFGVLAYLFFDVLVLWSAFLAVHTHPLPEFGVVVMAYIIGALGGSIPLPAAVGTIGGMVGMLILYGVAHNPAVAAVLLHQAIGLLVPVVGGGASYLMLRRTLSTISGQPPETKP
jgi:uncharacterized membrane protein YbhN (UPF0104 family)